jgi:transposase
VEEAANTFEPGDNRPLKIWTQDEARFGRMNNPKRSWAPAHIRPIVSLQRVREYLYLFSATCPKTGESFSLILPLVNTDAMNIFLQGLSVAYQSYRNIVIVDQAAWHTTEKLPKYDNIRFIYLPAGSPELNPTEHLWEHIRENYLANCIFDSIDALEEKLVDVIRRLIANQEIIRKLTGFHWLTGI